MPYEVTMLAWAGLVLVAQFFVMAVAVNLQLGTAYTGGPRDEKREPSGVAGRLHRAFTNMIEALMFFTVAVVVVTLGKVSSPATETAALIFVLARAVYVPAYASGIPLLRSAIWAVGFVATVFMIVQAVL